MHLPKLACSALLLAALAILIFLGCGPQAASQGAPAQVTLPAPVTRGKMSVEEAISKRRSIRQFADRDLTLAQIGQLLWAAQGITEKTRGLRAAPSAGATYPLELYLVKADGVFHYLPQGHRLERTLQGDLRTDLARAALGQRSVRAAPVCLVFTAVYPRTRARYGTRAERYVHLEVGHAAENVHLQAVALGLGSVPIGAFDDAAVARVLHLPSEHSPLYLVPVGYPAS